MNIVMRGSFCERRTAGRPLGVPYMGVPTLDGLLRGRPGVRDNRAGRSRQRL